MKIKINYSNGNSIELDHVNDYLFLCGTVYVKRDWIYGGYNVVGGELKDVESVEVIE